MTYTIKQIYLSCLYLGIWLRWVSQMYQNQGSQTPCSSCSIKIPNLSPEIHHSDQRKDQTQKQKAAY